MGVIEKDIQEKPVLKNDKKRQRLISDILDNLPQGFVISVDGPLAEILPRETIDRWNARAQDTEIAGDDAYKEGAADISLDSSVTPCFFYGDARLTEIPPCVIARVSAEAKEMSENYRALNARLGEQIRSRLEQMVSDSLNRRKSETK